MGWKKGPLPPNTWQWGGAIPQPGQGDMGFYFADFKGDHVIINPDTPNAKRVEAWEVAFYCNCLEIPIKVDGAEEVKGRAGPGAVIDLTGQGPTVTRDEGER